MADPALGDQREPPPAVLRGGESSRDPLRPQLHRVLEAQLARVYGSTPVWQAASCNCHAGPDPAFMTRGHGLRVEPTVTVNEQYWDLGLKLKHIVVDLGFRGVDAADPDKEIIHRGKFKSLSAKQKGWLKRRTAVEPAIGHLKTDHRMDRC